MPIGDKSYLNNSLEILKILLERGESVRYRKKLQGFGLYETKFDEYKPKTSRKIFRKRSREFLDLRLIEKLKSNDHKSDYYSITPLGIAYLFQQENIENKYQVRRIIQFLQFYFKKFIEENYKKEILEDYPIITSNIWEKQLKILDKNLLFDNLKFVLKGIRIESESNDHVIHLSFSLINYMTVNFYKFTFTNGKIYENYSGLSTRNNERDATWFNRDVSEFILSAYIYRLVISFTKISSFIATIDQNSQKKVSEYYDRQILDEAKGFNEWLTSLLKTKISYLSSLEVILNTSISSIENQITR